MKEKIKIFLQQNWFKVSLLIIIIIVIVGVFYWYEWRPNQIRKTCQEKIEKQDRELLESAIKSKILKEQGDIYDFCLRKYGLEK